MRNFTKIALLSIGLTACAGILAAAHAPKPQTTVLVGFSCDGETGPIIRASEDEFPICREIVRAAIDRSSRTEHHARPVTPGLWSAITTNIRTGDEYVVDYNLSREDCAAQMTTLDRPGIGVACERQP